MKLLIALFSILTFLSSHAERWDTTQYRPCRSADYDLLQASLSKDGPLIKELIETEALAHEALCLVKKNEVQLLRPTVCGIMIPNISEFKIRTQAQALFTIVVDASYQSCVRMRVIPTIESLQYQSSK
ncbi:MAG: hypothetical protein CME63_02935 [Halobacteriovoraceae bacterium]|nr:hypothetical protein [Halobacteriovoraceae bacterium]|tara:strand:- start:6769 stop:7152 length:384 start_codon:yes stop_codon:yes gene_type:complete